MPATRGSWTIDHGIAARWEADGLDAAFRNEWPADNGGYMPLNRDEARPRTPTPYCVYEKGTPVIVEHHTGADGGGEEQQIQQIPVQFTIHTKTTSSESAKNLAERMAKLVMAAYDPGRDRLTIDPDCHIITYRGADFDVRTGDEEWAWVILYEMLIDAEYSKGTS